MGYGSFLKHPLCSIYSLMITPREWKDYELIDSGHGMKLERWGSNPSVLLARPDPQAFWPTSLPPEEWEKADATYTRNSDGKGKWSFARELPESWTIHYKNLSFKIRPTSFKHTGLFPEQAVNWDWIMEQAEKKPGAKVLNLFGYTGGATVAAASAGAEVTHVDAAQGMVDWAKENLVLSGLSDAPVRLIVDDAMKFVMREKKRGNFYDGIIMDPPSFGHGAKGELWKLEKNLWPLVEQCAEILTPSPLFFLINSYTTGMAPTVLENVLRGALKNRPGTFSNGEIGLESKKTGVTLPAGIFSRWEAE